MNRRGNLITRVIVLAISVLVVTYMGVHILDALYNPVKTVMAVLSGSEETAKANGVFIRNEILIGKSGDIFDLKVDEGARVSKNQRVASVYSDVSALSRAEELKSLDAQIKQLEYAENSDGDILDAGRQNDLIYSAIFDIAHNAGQNDYAHLERDGLKLKSLILRREYSRSGSKALERQSEALKARRAGISEAAQRGVTDIYAPESGMFTAMIDGLEDKLPSADTITMKELQAVLNDAAQPDTSRWLGKVVHDFDWYYAASMKSEDAVRLEAGKRAKIRFTSGYDGEINVSVIRVDTSETGETLVVFNSSEAMAGTVALRRQDAEIIFVTYEGVQIPKEAIRLDGEGVRGVYCVMGMAVSFKPVEVIFEKDNYYLVKYSPEEKNALRPGDEVVVAGKDLFDGKIIR